MRFTAVATTLILILFLAIAGFSPSENLGVRLCRGWFPVSLGFHEFDIKDIYANLLGMSTGITLCIIIETLRSRTMKRGQWIPYQPTRRYPLMKRSCEEEEGRVEGEDEEDSAVVVVTEDVDELDRAFAGRKER
ncbi:hypothetical protein BC829DRAFT_381843 [Chytridium lagenaria]|nr:hypothetical protein BC829DRAFT_381843 [Chytridium lagenaria]